MDSTVLVALITALSSLIVGVWNILRNTGIDKRKMGMEIEKTLRDELDEIRKLLNNCYDEFNKYKEETSMKIIKLQGQAEDLRTTALRMARARKQEKSRDNKGTPPGGKKDV